MKASLEVELEDAPGELRKLLGVFEAVGGNIISVTHIRERKANSHVPVEIVFNIGSKDALEKMGALLKEGSWRVLSLEKIAQFRRITLGLIGHIIRTKSVESLVNKVDALGANVSKFSVNMPNQNGESSALISFEAEDDEVIEKAMVEIENTCRQNDLLLIRAVD